MDVLIERIKDIIVATCMVICSIVAPIKTALIVLGVCALFNFIIGWKTDVHVYKRDFSTSKAFNSIKMLLFWAFTCLVVHLTINLFGEEDLANVFLKYLTWIVSYWYLVNVLKNAKKLFPKSESIKFVYDLVTIEIIAILKSKFLGNIKK